MERVIRIPCGGKFRNGQSSNPTASVQALNPFLKQAHWILKRNQKVESAKPTYRMMMNDLFW